MRLPWFRNIRTKATILILALLTATVFVSYVISVQIMNSQVTDKILRTAESLGRSIATAAGFLIGAQDLLGLDYLVFQIKQTNPDIMSIAVLGPERKILVHSDIKERGEKLEPVDGIFLKRREDGTIVRRLPSAPGDLVEIESPIVFMNKNFGSVVLSVDWSVLSTAWDEARRRVLGFFAAVLVLGVIGSVLLSSGLTRPIKELLSGVEQLKQGKISRQPRIFSKDELGNLTASFNDMSALITSQKDRLAESARDLEAAYVSTIRIVAAALDARDSYTHGHSTRVSELTVALAREFGWTGPQLNEIEIACLFHDVGKIKISDAILHKKGRLDPDEWKEMQKHPEYGAEILGKAPTLNKFIPAVRHHHEWYDGSGYPDGLRGDAIPLAAAMISLADAYDAMTSDRPYRIAMTRENALQTIKDYRGKQFNPDLTMIFLEIAERQFAPTSALPQPG
jgi:putative nucleotidyltransferase with HDIG domain